MKLELEWMEPPESLTSGPRGKHAAIVAELQKRPGEWARVQKGMKSNSLASHLRKRGAEATTRKTSDGTWDCYARWPEKKAAPEQEAVIPAAQLPAPARPLPARPADPQKVPGTSAKPEPGGQQEPEREEGAQGPRPLVAQRVSKPRPQVQGAAAESASGQGDLTPDQITAQRRARLAAMRGGDRG